MKSPWWLLLLATLVGCTVLTAEHPNGGDSGTGDDTGPTFTEGRWHPDGYADPSMHGQAAKMGDEVCVECHGDRLDGGSAGQGCDECHLQGWRTDCTYCHGGEDNDSGAPPRDIDDTRTSTSTFPPHTRHVESTITTPPACSECHLQPTGVLDAGHVFVGDTTPGVSEVVLAGRAAGGTYTGTSCTVYCHGTGSVRGTVQVTGAAMTCTSCHAGPTSVSFTNIGGQHSRHMRQGIKCGECHTPSTTNSTITTPARHIDGHVDVGFTVGSFSYNSGRCTGACHNKLHFSERW